MNNSASSRMTDSKEAVTVATFVRAETDIAIKKVYDYSKGEFGKWLHRREPTIHLQKGFTRRRAGAELAARTRWSFLRYLADILAETRSTVGSMEYSTD